MEEKELTEQALTQKRSRRRLFIAFILLDALLLALIIYQIYLLAVN